ncbi:MAG: fatty acid/phospholipid synthesis protein PlsX [Clostridiales bacterium]|nr:fatty acid/phospholipid synthesis protein PlsX [Clostridiales bacterium]
MKDKAYQAYSQFFASIVEQDNCAVVICNMEHEIIYMNPAAVKNYEKHGGERLVGASIFGCHNERSSERIRKVTEWFAQSPAHNRVHTFFHEKQNKDVYMIALRDTSGKLIGYYEKHEFRTRDNTPFYEMGENF